MLRTFNMGLGMLIVVPAKKFKKAQTLLERAGREVLQRRAHRQRRPQSSLQLGLSIF